MQVFQHIDSLMHERGNMIAAGAFYQLQKNCLQELFHTLKPSISPRPVCINILPPDVLTPILLSEEEIHQLMKKLGFHKFLSCTFEAFQQFIQEYSTQSEETGLGGIKHFCGFSRGGIEDGTEAFIQQPFAATPRFSWHQRLGYFYPLAGHVVYGNQIGRTLGFPTANLRPFETAKILPPMGVYSGWIKHKSSWFKAMINIGIRPTLDLDNVTIEAHLFDFEGDIYGENISIVFYERIRNEMRFPSLEVLKQQLVQDRKTALKMLEGSPHSPGTDILFPFIQQC